MTTFEACRFSFWFYKHSIRWVLPKKCTTCLLILTFLKFNEKRNIIHAHRNLISQFVPYEKSVKRSARLSNFWRVCVLSSAKNGHWSAAKMVIFKNIKKKLIPVTTFEVYRFSLWFYKNSIRWSLPKKCITSLLILTFLKFNEKRNIIHAHRNLISQFVPYEKSVRRCPNLKILQDAPKTDVRKMVTGLQRKWWFSKTLKKAYTSDNFWSLSFQSLVL